MIKELRLGKEKFLKEKQISTLTKKNSLAFKSTEEKSK